MPRHISDASNIETLGAGPLGDTHDRVVYLLFPVRVTQVGTFVWMAFRFGLASFCDLFDKTD